MVYNYMKKGRKRVKPAAVAEGVRAKFAVMAEFNSYLSLNLFLVSKTQIITGFQKEELLLYYAIS